MMGETVCVVKPEFFRQCSTTTIRTVLFTKDVCLCKSLVFLLKLEKCIVYPVSSQENKAYLLPFRIKVLGLFMGRKIM